MSIPVDGITAGYFGFCIDFKCFHGYVRCVRDGFSDSKRVIFSQTFKNALETIERVARNLHVVLNLEEGLCI